MDCGCHLGIFVAGLWIKNPRESPQSWGRHVPANRVPRTEYLPRDPRTMDVTRQGAKRQSPREGNGITHGLGGGPRSYSEGSPNRLWRKLPEPIPIPIQPPQRGDTARFHQLTCAARAAREASDTAVLTEAQWRHVDDVLAAFVPDFERTDSTPAERRALVKDVVSALQTVHGRAAGVVRDWQAAHRIELERRRDQEKYRGLLRTVVRAWREESDGRHARSLRVALPKAKGSSWRWAGMQGGWAQGIVCRQRMCRGAHQGWSYVLP